MRFPRIRVRVRSLCTTTTASGFVVACSFSPLNFRANPAFCETNTCSELREFSDVDVSSSSVFHSWGKKIGLTLDPKIKMFETPQSGKGLCVTGGIVTKGSSIISVPTTRLITADNIENDPQLGHIIGPLRAAGLDDRGSLALWLLVHSLDKFSPWREYIALLPRQYELSRNHLLLSRDQLHVTNIGISIRKMKENISRQIRNVLRAIRKLDPPVSLLNLSPGDLEQAWTWAHAVVMSRTGVIHTELEAKDWTDLPVSIIPAIDFCNHSDDPVAHVTVNDDCVQLIALRDIHPGEEITIRYWTANEELTCEQSLFSFGFLSKVNRFILPGINFDGADESPKKAIQRLVFLEKCATDENICLDDIESAIHYFTVESMNEREVIQLARLLSLEGGIGEQTRGLLASKAESGKLKFIHAITSWERELDKCQVYSPAVIEYKQRLLLAINKTKMFLDS